MIKIISEFLIRNYPKKLKFMAISLFNFPHADMSPMNFSKVQIFCLIIPKVKTDLINYCRHSRFSFSQTQNIKKLSSHEELPSLLKILSSNLKINIRIIFFEK